VNDVYIGWLLIGWLLAFWAGLDLQKRATRWWQERRAAEAES
jgi:hypothetical protein